MINVVESPIDGGSIQGYNCYVKVQGQPKLIEWNEKNDDHFGYGAKEKKPAPNRRHNKFDPAVFRGDLKGLWTFNHRFSVNETNFELSRKKFEIVSNKVALLP